MQAPPPPILRAAAAAATAAPSCAATATAASPGTPMSSAITNSSAMAPSTFLPAPLPSPNTAAAATALFRVNNNGSNGAIATSSAPFRSSNLGPFPPADGRAMMMQSLQNGSSINQQQHMQQQAHQQQPRLQQRRMSLDNQKPQHDDDELDDDLDEDDLDEEDDGDDDMGNNELEAKLSRSMDGGAGLKAESQQQQQQAASKTSTTGNGNPAQPTIRKRNVGVPKFLRFLYQMLELEDREIIAWSHKGTAFQIRQPDELAERILPKYFKHNKVSSFQRQLNYFGFKKWTKTQTTICTFSHPFFLRGEKDKMKLIKRKERMGPMGVASAASASSGAGSAGCESSDNSNNNNNNDTNGGGDSFDASANPDVPTKMPTIPAKPGASLNKRLRANSTVKHKGIGARELAMRRHSTGALALSASLMPPGAVGAAAAALINRKRSGTVDLELELQAQKGMDINKEPALRLPSRAKRKSLPHVMLPPTLKDRKGNQLFSNMDFGGGVGDFRNFSSSMGSATASVSFGAGSGYFGHRISPESVPTMKQDASAILPVSSEMMLQQVYLRQHSHPGAIGTGNGGVAQFQLSSMKSDNSIDMSDLSGPLQSSAASWGMQSNNGYQPQQQQHAVLHKDPNMMMMHPFKFGEASGASSTFDNMPIMDYATNSAQLSSHTLKTHNQQQPHQQFGSYLHHHQQQQLQQQQQQQQPQQKDYIDVLLESAALEDQLSTQSSEPQASGIPTPWNQHYLQAAHHQQQQQQQQHPSHQAHVSPYGLMQQQQAHHMNQQQQQHQHHHSLQQQMQLSAMNDLNNSQAHRF